MTAFTGTDGTKGLDDSQLAVVEGGADRRLIVSAGPGSGKTKTLLARARWLESSAGVAPGSELIILSFSRAAVEVLDSRTGTAQATGALPVRTFDSLASRVISETGRPTEGLDFDGRIGVATSILESTGPSGPLVESLRHVLIDESQDIVGVRSEFVLALLKRVCESESGGFTMFGDRAQGIYGFGCDRGTFLDLDSAVMAQEKRVESLSLMTNYRTQSPEIESIIDRFGPRIRIANEGQAEGLWRELHDELFLHGDSGWNDYDEAVAVVRGELGIPGTGKVAVLCRTNAEVLDIGARLQAGGLDVAVRHRAEDRGASPWVADLFARATGTSAPMPSTSARASDRAAFSVPSDALVRLRSAGVAQGESVNLGVLGDRIRYGNCPESLSLNRQAKITVSTIHRAKGLEFDTVFLIRAGKDPEESFLDEIKILFVALSRARTTLLCNSKVDFKGPVRRDVRSARSTVRYWRSLNIREIEMRISDSDPDWIPADPARFQAVQNRLRNGYAAGDSVSLVLAGSNDGDHAYDVVHIDADGEAMTVGATVAQFGETSSRLFSADPPARIDGLAAETPDTASMIDSRAQKVGIGAHGLHLRARFFGLGNVVRREGAEDV